MLVVEDDQVIGQAMRELLEQRGWRVRLATSVREARAALKKRLGRGKRIARVVLDLRLPDGDGLEILEMIRHSSAATEVIVVTGVEDAEHLARARALEPAALLQKPFDFDRLLEALERQ